MAERLLYLANNRLPTEKAHGLQIVQMCEALADAGYDVTLAAPRRANTPQMRSAPPLWEHYGVRRNFAFVRLPCLDLFPLFPRYHVAFLVQTFTYLLALLIWRLGHRADVIYTRDLFIGFAAALGRTTLIYEVHQTHRSWLGRRMQAFVARRACNVPVTHHLAEYLRAVGAERVLVAHDGIRAERFESMPDRHTARSALGIDPQAFVVGYVGRLHTMGIPKGLDTLVDAISLASQEDENIELLLVGGPEEGIDVIRRQWQALGLGPEQLHAVGQIKPDDVPLYLATMDVGAMPLPWTDHFAYHASALKLFEYMAAGCVVLASALPSVEEVVRDGESALLVPPGDAHALAGAIQRLRRDPALRERLAAQACSLVMNRYTWQARAEAIRQFVTPHARTGESQGH